MHPVTSAHRLLSWLPSTAPRFKQLPTAEGPDFLPRIGGIEHGNPGVATALISISSAHPGGMRFFGQVRRPGSASS